MDRHALAAAIYPTLIARAGQGEGGAMTHRLTRENHSETMEITAKSAYEWADAFIAVRDASRQYTVG